LETYSENGETTVPLVTLPESMKNPLFELDSLYENELPEEPVDVLRVIVTVDCE
jgi:hypothetical protein